MSYPMNIAKHGQEYFVVFAWSGVVLLNFRLIPTVRRLTFEIIEQDERTRYRGDDDGPYYTFKAANGYEVISRSRMDIQTERLWLLGACENERSGTMVFSSDEKRDIAYDKFIEALSEWGFHWADKL